VTDGGSSAVEQRQYMPEVDGSNPSPRSLIYLRFRKHFGVRWGEWLGRPECPYLRRWALNLGLVSFRIHHFFRSDDDRAFHDHPWWFLTIVLRGSYDDVSPAGVDRLTPGSIRFRRALHRHTVTTTGAWTFVVTGPNVRAWGFWENGVRFRKSNKWFAMRGHHPCDQP
jgi:hypothetical protein